MDSKLIPTSNVLLQGQNPSWKDDFADLKDRYKKEFITGKGTYGYSATSDSDASTRSAVCPIPTSSTLSRRSNC